MRSTFLQTAPCSGHSSNCGRRGAACIRSCLASRRGLPGALMLGVALLLSACVPPSDAEFTLSGIAEHQQCLENASPIRPSVSYARIDADGVGLFFQTDGRQASAGDSVYLQVYQPERVRANLGEPFELADPRELEDGDHHFDTPPVVRGVAYFAQSCPDVSESFGLTGTVIFEKLGDKRGEHITGVLQDAQIISLRDDTVVATDFSGDWDFEIDPTRPYQYFPTYPTENHAGRLP